MSRSTHRVHGVLGLNRGMCAAPAHADGRTMRLSRRRLLLAISACAFGAGAVPTLAAAACPLAPGPVWADYGGPGVYGKPVASVLARPGVTLGVGNDDWAADYRADGADTAGWHMRLKDIVGTHVRPKPRSAVLRKVPGLVGLARRMSTCDPPWLALNEMQAVQMPEPLSRSVLRYRNNVLALATKLNRAGVRTFLLIPRIPQQRTRYARYWRSLALQANLVYEAYSFSSRTAIRPGGERYLREKWTAAMSRLLKFARKPSRMGIMIPYWTKHRLSGREGLRDAAWFRLTRIKTDAVESVARSFRLGTIWSWGWQTNPAVGEVDPDKKKAACYYLQARDPALCDPSTI